MAKLIVLVELAPLTTDELVHWQLFKFDAIYVMEVLIDKIIFDDESTIDRIDV